jgi:hypothetical protein
MNCDRDRDKSTLEDSLKEIETSLWTLAKEHSEDITALLSLLRTLENLHRDIRTQLFEPSLPNTRNALYHLLRDIEETGGWPYIERMKLQALLSHLLAPEGSE